MPANTQLSDDLACLQHEAASLADAGNKVLVVCHSYGGVVTTNALTEDLSIEWRKKNGKVGGVVGLVYICAFMTQIDQSLVNIVTDSGAILKNAFSKPGCAWPENPLDAFYSDCEPIEAQSLADKLVIHSLAGHIAKTTHTAWLYFPVTYIFCEKDRCVVVKRQQEMVEAVRQKGRIVTTETLDTGHSPFLVKPDETAALVRSAWERYAGGGETTEMPMIAAP